jgi:HSP20 family protein
MLFRFDPFEQIDRTKGRARLLAMDAIRKDDEIVIYLDAPGVRPDDIDLTVEKGSLTVTASRAWRDEEATTLVRERMQGQFRRQLQVGDNLDTEGAKAKLEDGVLVISVPIAADATARRIEITGGGTQRDVTPTSVAQATDSDDPA